MGAMWSAMQSLKPAATAASRWKMPWSARPPVCPSACDGQAAEARARLDYSGTGFVGAVPPASATMVKGATTAAKEAVESVANANT